MGVTLTMNFKRILLRVSGRQMRTKLDENDRKAQEAIKEAKRVEALYNQFKLEQLVQEVRRNADKGNFE